MADCAPQVLFFVDVLVAGPPSLFVQLHGAALVTWLCSGLVAAATAALMSLLAGDKLKTGNVGIPFSFVSSASGRNRPRRLFVFSNDLEKTPIKVVC